MSRIVKKGLALSLALGMLLGGAAQAATTYDTSIGFKASRTQIEKEQKVIFSGKLKSEFAKCRKDQTVQLLRGGNPAGITTTNVRGEYEFVKRPSVTRTWKVRFAGDSGGTHPNQWVCSSSVSKKIRVRVT